jgi:hypothetical protein
LASKYFISQRADKWRSSHWMTWLYKKLITFPDLAKTSISETPANSILFTEACFNLRRTRYFGLSLFSVAVANIPTGRNYKQSMSNFLGGETLAWQVGKKYSNPLYNKKAAWCSGTSSNFYQDKYNISSSLNIYLLRMHKNAIWENSGKRMKFVKKTLNIWT